MGRTTGIEPATTSTTNWRSTTELHPPYNQNISLHFKIRQILEKFKLYTKRYLVSRILLCSRIHNILLTKITNIYLTNYEQK